MRAYADRAPGVQLVTDPVMPTGDFRTPPPDAPTLADDRDDRDLVVVRGRLSAGIAVQLLLDRKCGELFVTTVVGGKCLTVPVERENANDYFEHPGAYGLLPQLDR